MERLVADNGLLNTPDRVKIVDALEVIRQPRVQQSEATPPPPPRRLLLLCGSRRRNVHHVCQNIPMTREKRRKYVAPMLMLLLHRSAVDLPGCDDLIWWHHTELLLRRLAPHAALEEVPDLERLVRDCMVGSAAENRRVLSYLNREWVQRVCRRFNEELMEARLASHSSLDATRDLLLNRVPVFARHLNGRRDSCRVLALCGPRAWISHANYFTGVAAFASLAVDKARLANPRRACPFCHAPGLFTTPHIVAECRSPVIVHERAGILQPVFDSLSVFQRGCIPDPVLPDPHGVWVALATGVSHPLVRWSCDKRWEPWQHALYVQAAVYLNRVISASMVAFEELEATLDVSERE